MVHPRTDDQLSGRWPRSRGKRRHFRTLIFPCLSVTIRRSWQTVLLPRIVVGVRSRRSTVRRSKLGASTPCVPNSSYKRLKRCVQRTFRVTRDIRYLYDILYILATKLIVKFPKSCVLNIISLYLMLVIAVQKKLIVGCLNAWYVFWHSTGWNPR